MEAGKSSLHSSCEGKCGIGLDSLQGTPASRRVEGGILRSFSICSRKPWVPSTCDGDFRELFRVPMGRQEYCGVGMGLLVLHWVWCNGRVPLLELRWEHQGSSRVLTWVSGCVCLFKQGVRSQHVCSMERYFPLELSEGFQASRRVEFGTWGSFSFSNQGIRTPFML